MNFYDEDNNTTGPMWFEFTSNVTRLGFHLVEDLEYNAEQLQCYYEKPWKWTEEYFARTSNGALEKYEEE